MFPKVPLILAPTPLHRLANLSERLGFDLWIKRDDLTGFAMGGNKGRKLEYLIADALREEADTIVTCGSIQSNFIRQLGAACARHGLSCAAAAMSLPYLSPNEKPDVPGLRPTGGNALLDEWLGVDLRVFPDGTWDDLYAAAKGLADELRQAGRKVYEVPVGGSSALGAYAFAQAGKELMDQAAAGFSTEGAESESTATYTKEFDWILFASSSGSTHTGLAYAFHGTQTNVLGIACDPEPDLADDFQALYEKLEALTGQSRPMRRADWRLDFRFVGPGYGIPSEAGRQAIRLMARSEGIFLDPIYSGKAFAGLLALAEAGELGGRVLFWHTGGHPALFAME
ncbi:MAG TPA: D-cysteine desulfhydrase family protein [Fimbriimonadaceae bacterium]|nr:D-cysteine desulfhydrase family protein [Fimbriimonadaceae bacterium]